MVRVYPNMNYKGRRKHKVSGHKDGWIYGPVYYDRDGRAYQNVRRMPEKSEHVLTSGQKVETNDFQRVMALHHALKDAYQDCFEGKGKSYGRFISENRKAGVGHIVISKGSLPALHYSFPAPEETAGAKVQEFKGSRVQDCGVEFDYVAADWQEGDILRQVRVTIDGKDYFALIHMRPTEDGWLVSSQEMVEVGCEEIRNTENEEPTEVVEQAEPDAEAMVNNFIETLCLMRLAFTRQKIRP